MKPIIFTLLCIIISIVSTKGQIPNNGTIEGRLFNARTNEPIPFAKITITGSTKTTETSDNGTFSFQGIEPGYISLTIYSIGHSSRTTEPLLVTNAKKTFIEIPLEEIQVTLKEVTVKASPFEKKIESPLSLKRIGTMEIERLPGANRDISKVIQAYPGVSSTPAYRNDVIVRGGGAAENRFFLDGIEIPNLNHFATQGASGGPVGIINVDFVRDVSFYSSAFPANRGNALSSVLEFTQVDGNKEKTKFKGSIGASDLALTLDGPINSKTTFVASARRSYLQFLFSALQLPFLPTYNDFQFKIRSRLSDKTELTAIGLGAYDINKLNLKANKTEKQRYILSYLPENKQWNYTLGFVMKHFGKQSTDIWAISRNQLNNVQNKFRNNIEEDSMRVLDYDSYEIENKFRYEKTIRQSSGYKINLGANLEYASYYNRTYRQQITGTASTYKTDIDFMKWGFFGQISKAFWDDRLSLSLGVRVDANNYSTKMNNLLDQFSPRFSASYTLTPKMTFNTSLGRYYQLPPYTSLGYRDNAGALINKEKGITYISADHLVTGIDYLPTQASKFSVEGFYKWYRNYPLSVSDSVSISSKSADFGTYGDEQVLSLSKGKAYGLELFYQNKDLQGINFILSYTLVRSEATDYKGNFLPTAWDNKHILNLTAMKQLKHNWDVGFKWRFVGGAPYTPWNLDKSSLAAAWDAQGKGYLDYSRFNQLRLNAFHQLDIRIDKEYFYKQWSLRFYLDIQNVYGYKAQEPDQLIRQNDANGTPLPASENPPRYQLKTIGNTAGTVLPTIGVIAEF